MAALTSNGVGTCGADDNQAQAGHLIAETIGGGQVTHSLTSEGHDASEDGTGRGTPIAAITIRGRATGFHMTQDPISSEEQVPCIGSKSVGNGVMVTPLAIRGREHGAELEIGPEGGPQGSLRSAGGGGGGSLHSLVSIQSSDTPESFTDIGQGQRIRTTDEPTETLRATKRGPYSDNTATVVRRLTERECERLQGYDDDWTAGQSGSARYRQLGNSVAVPVVEWIARRMVAVDDQIRGET